MYGAVDPFYMIMLIKRLGHDYVVWDRAATIRFEAPGRATLYATFRIDDDELDTIRAQLEQQASVERVYRVELVDREGKVHAAVDKTIYIRKKKPAPPRAG
jgi:hypothetical protein